MQVEIAGQPWFAEDDYDSFRSILPNRHWHASHSAWLAAAEQTEKGLEQRGIRAVKVHVRADAFVSWCKARGVNVDTKALIDFANEFAMRVHTGEKGH